MDASSYDQIPVHEPRLSADASGPSRDDRADLRHLAAGCHGLPRARAWLRERRQSDPDGVQPARQRVRRHRSLARAGRRGAAAISRALGLRNIRIEQASIVDIDDRMGSVRLHHLPRRLLVGRARGAGRDPADRVAESQPPTGVAYVSYNTYPGWHMRDDGAAHDAVSRRAVHRSDRAGRAGAGAAVVSRVRIGGHRRRTTSC